MAKKRERERQKKRKKEKTIELSNVNFLIPVETLQCLKTKGALGERNTCLVVMTSWAISSVSIQQRGGEDQC